MSDPGDSPPTPPKGTIPPRPDLPRPAPRRTSVLSLLLLAVGGLLVFGALLVAAVLVTRSNSGSSVVVGEPTAAATFAPPSGPAQRLTGTFSYPGTCAHEMKLRIDDPSGTTLAEVPLSQGASRQGCVETFSTDIPRADAYALSLIVGVSTSANPTVLRGPTYSWQDLQAKDFTLSLTLENFGGNTATAQVRSDLQTAIDAARSYYQRHKTFVGLSPSTLHQLAPSLRFNSAQHAKKGEVSLRLATPTLVMFAEVSSDGTPIVMGFHPPQLICYGEIDAKTFQQCIAWQPSGPSGGGPSSQQSPTLM